MRDRARGALLGTLLGDSLGRPFEGTPIGDLSRLAAAVQGRLRAPHAWGYSDDTEMTMSVAESLIATGAVDPAHLLRTLAERCDVARGYGKGTRAAFRVALAGGSVEDASRAAWSSGSRGNGAAVRVAPLAIRFHRTDPAELSELARRSAVATHRHPEATDGCAVMAIAIQSALRGLTPTEVLTTTRASAPDEYVNRLSAALHILRSPPFAVAGALGHGVLAIESVPAALWAAAGAPSFDEAVVRAVSLGGDTDTIGAMAGAVAGACFGASGIPVSWIQAAETGAAARLVGHADALLDAACDAA